VEYSEYFEKQFAKHIDNIHATALVKKIDVASTLAPPTQSTV
jgi:hypothetical protein